MITDGVFKKCRKRTVMILLLILVLFMVTVCAQVRFDPQGKRDPFVSLLKKEKVIEVAQILPPPPLEERPPGLAGLLISEVTVTGTASSSETQMAILLGIDGMTYFAQEGTKLFDGYLERISPEEVIFLHQQEDTRGKKRVSKVTKRIQTEDQ
jgi:hypothetical protein